MIRSGRKVSIGLMCSVGCVFGYIVRLVIVFLLWVGVRSGIYRGVWPF